MMEASAYADNEAKKRRVRSIVIDMLEDAVTNNPDCGPHCKVWHCYNQDCAYAMLTDVNAGWCHACNKEDTHPCVPVEFPCVCECHYVR